MASGWIYILTNPIYPNDFLKIGKTTRSPAARAKELSSTGVPAKFKVAYKIKVSDCDYIETLIHDRFRKFRYSNDKEFFQLPLRKAVSIVDKVVIEVENPSFLKKLLSFFFSDDNPIASKPKKLSKSSPDYS